jgi:hypothetical protein
MRCIRSTAAGAEAEKIAAKDEMTRRGSSRWPRPTRFAASASARSAAPHACHGSANFRVALLAVLKNAAYHFKGAEAGRILLTASSHRGVQPEDRTYLIRLTSAQTGLAPADAERRVDDVIARAKDNIARARRSAVILAFMAGAAAMVGAVVAWFAGWAGGEQRDGRAAPHMLWDWGRRVRRS